MPPRPPLKPPLLLKLGTLQEELVENEHSKMEAVVNTVRGLWQPQDHETISQKSLFGRSPACSFHAWRCAATKRRTCRELFEITFSRREKLTVVCKKPPRKPNHRVHPRIASRRRAILKKLSTCTPKGPSLPFRTSGLFWIYFLKHIFG